MALFIHGGLVQAARSSGVGGMDILVCASRNAVQLILEGRSEVLIRQTLACFLFHITGQVNETSQHIVLVGIADLDHHDIGALGIFVARTLNEVRGSGESIGDIVHVAQNALRQRGQFSKGHSASRLIDRADLGVDLILGVGIGNAVTVQSSCLVSLALQNSSQRVIEVRLRNLCLESQSGQTLDGDISTVHGNTAILGASGDQDVNHLIGNSQRSTVHLDPLKDVGLRANMLQSINTRRQSIGDLFLLGTQCLQVSQFCQMFLIVSHSSFPPKFSVIYSP